MLIYQTPKGQKHTVHVYLKDGRVERFKNIVEINRLHSRYAWGVQDEYDFLEDNRRTSHAVRTEEIEKLEIFF